MDNKLKVKRNLIYSALGQIVTISIGLILPRLFIVGYGSSVNGLIGSINQLLVYLGLFEAGVGATALIALYKPVSECAYAEINSILSATNQYYKKTATLYLVALSIVALLFPVVTDSSLDYVSVFLIVFFSGVGNVVNFYFQTTFH